MFTQGDLMLKSFDFKRLGSLLLQTWVTSFTRGECVFNMDGFEGGDRLHPPFLYCGTGHCYILVIATNQGAEGPNQHM